MARLVNEFFEGYKPVSKVLELGEKQSVSMLEYRISSGQGLAIGTPFDSRGFSQNFMSVFAFDEVCRNGDFANLTFPMVFGFAKNGVDLLGLQFKFSFYSNGEVRVATESNFSEELSRKLNQQKLDSIASCLLNDYRSNLMGFRDYLLTVDDFDGLKIVEDEKQLLEDTIFQVRKPKEVNLISGIEQKPAYVIVNERNINRDDAFVPNFPYE